MLPGEDAFRVRINNGNTDNDGIYNSYGRLSHNNESFVLDNFTFIRIDYIYDFESVDPGNNLNWNNYEWYNNSWNLMSVTNEHTPYTNYVNPYPLPSRDNGYYWNYGSNNNNNLSDGRSGGVTMAPWNDRDNHPQYPLRFISEILHVKANSKIIIHSRGGGRGNREISYIDEPDDLKDYTGGSGFLGFGILDVNSNSYLQVFRRQNNGNAFNSSSRETFEYILTSDTTIQIELLDSYWSSGFLGMGAWGTINLQRVEIIHLSS